MADNFPTTLDPTYGQFKYSYAPSPAASLLTIPTNAPANVFTSTSVQLSQNLISGTIPNPSSQPTTVDQTIATNPSTQPSQTGSDALQAKATSPYSNKQFIAPFRFAINVEGTMVVVDNSGKRINTNPKQPYRAIVSLSASNLPSSIIHDPFLLSNQHITKSVNPRNGASIVNIPQGTLGSATQSTAAQIFNTGAGGIFQNTSNRFLQFTQSSPQSLLQSGSNLLSNLQNTLKTTGNILTIGGNTLNTGQIVGGALNIANTITGNPAAAINQQVTQYIAKVPGLTLGLNALGQIPGGSSITQALNNPVGAAGSLLAFAASKAVDIQATLPSLTVQAQGEISIGVQGVTGLANTLGNAYGLAQDIFHNGPPTSIQGIFALEQRIKALVCQFEAELQLLITFINQFDQLQAIFNGFTATIKTLDAKGLLKKLKKLIEDEIKNILKQFNIQEILRQIREALIKALNDLLALLFDCNYGSSSSTDSSGTTATAGGAGKDAESTPTSPETAATFDSSLTTANPYQTASTIGTYGVMNQENPIVMDTSYVSLYNSMQQYGGTPTPPPQPTTGQLTIGGGTGAFNNITPPQVPTSVVPLSQPQNNTGTGVNTSTTITYNAKP